MSNSNQELKTILREMIHELAELKTRITELEKKLGAGEEEPPLSDAVKIELQAESYEHLGRIYYEGYHVCPIAFGERRHEQCLFCLVFLERE